MNNSTDLTADILAQTQQKNIKFIDLQFTDVVGVVKNVTIPAHELPAALENGIWFDGSSIEGFARVAESDMHLRPDPSTFAIIPCPSRLPQRVAGSPSTAYCGQVPRSRSRKRRQVFPGKARGARSW